MKHISTSLAALLAGILGLGHAAHAQGNYVNEALLYSRQGPAGTARTLGLGGASASLGGDYGSVNTNPAGLGLYTKSELTLTPGVGYNTSTGTTVPYTATNGSAIGGLPINQQANDFHLESLGLVFANRRPDNSGSDWRGGSFALGFTRLANFNYSFGYHNTLNDDNSFYQLLREPEGVASTPITSPAYQNALTFINNQYTNGIVDLDGLAYNNFLTNIRTVTDPGTGTQYGQLYIVHPRTGQVQQDGLVQSTGSLSQFDLAYGGNYRDRFYVGGGVSIVSMNRTLNSTFGESQGGVEDFHYNDYLHTTGTGINARLGIIVRPVDAVRIGLSAQTPTYISLTDSYQTTLTVNQSYVTGNFSNVLSTDPGSYDYSVTLPFRANGGLTLLLGKYGFFTGDVEYVGYSQTHFDPNANDTSTSFSDVNQAISTGYKNTFNFKGGLEGRFAIFRARIGYAYYGNPYVGGTLDRSISYYTAGVGIRTKAFFVDVANQYTTSKDQFSPYTLYVAANSPREGLSSHRDIVSVTGGFLF